LKFTKLNDPKRKENAMDTKSEFSERRSWTRFKDRAIFRPITMPAISSNDFFYPRYFRWTKAKSLTTLAGLILTISFTVRADWTSLNPGVLGVNDSVSGFAVDDSGNLYVGGSFNVAGTLPANYIAKWDGAAWSAFGPGPKGQVYALAVSGTNLYAGGYFTNAGGVVTPGVVKWDGTAWSALGSGMNGAVYALAVSGTNLYAGGSFTNADGISAKYIAKWDGGKWSAVGSGMASTVYALALNGTNLYAGGSFTNVGGVKSGGIAKWDGNTWSAVGLGLGGTLPYVYAFAVSGTDLYAGGSFTSAGGVSAVGVAKWNGISWTNLGTGLGNPGDYTGTSIGALTVSGTNLFAGGYLTTPGDPNIHRGVAAWDGSAWRVLGYVYYNGINALAVSGTNLFAGGNFELIDSALGAVTALNIAEWNGSTWAPLISGINARVSALAVNGDEIYAGGDFTHVPGGVTANYIAKWDAHAWSSLGLGMNGPVRALAVNGSDLYAGGTFTKAGDMPANYIAKWDGNSWSALDAGLDGPVYALAVNGGNLYAGGAFTHAGGVPAQYVAKWDGNTWSALGSGVDGSVLALALNGTNLYAAGYFGSVARWDGNTWSPLTTFLDGSVNALAVSGTDLCIGGNFSRIGGVPARYIAKWDGNAWSPLGSWSGGAVFALAVEGTNLYAGGQAYSVLWPYDVAKWDGNSWLSLGIVSGAGIYLTDVEALAADGRGHLFVGGDFYIANTVMSPFIAQINLPGAPTILMPPQSQTAEAGSTVNIVLDASGYPAVTYFWFYNVTNLVSCTTNCWLELTNCDFSQSGTYNVVVSNAVGAVTSAPVTLNVISAVERRPVPGVKVMGEIGSSLNIEHTESLGPAPIWLPLDTVSLTNPPQYCFDLTAPLPSQRFYRAQLLSDPPLLPVLDLHMLPAITLTGNIGDKLRLDCINQIGPTDAWVTLETVTLTNTSQLYFDTSALGQPGRLYRIVPVP
jgi:hypothetical protein